VVLRKKKKEDIKLNNFKCSLLIIPSKDESGLLYNILKLFSDLKINLNAIMSRPTKEGLGKYYFYVEFFSNKDNLENIIKLFEETKLRNDFIIKDLGLYLGEGVE
jgi:prephenate dehydratase